LSDVGLVIRIRREARARTWIHGTKAVQVYGEQYGQHIINHRARMRDLYAGSTHLDLAGELAGLALKLGARLSTGYRVCVEVGRGVAAGSVEGALGQ
jgi:hypothetical protein